MEGSGAQRTIRYIFRLSHLIQVAPVIPEETTVSQRHSSQVQVQPNADDHDLANSCLQFTVSGPTIQVQLRVRFFFIYGRQQITSIMQGKCYQKLQLLKGLSEQKNGSTRLSVLFQNTLGIFFFSLKIISCQSACPEQHNAYKLNAVHCKDNLELFHSSN